MTTTAAATVLGPIVGAFARDFDIDTKRCSQEQLTRAWLLTTLCDDDAWQHLGRQVVGDYVVSCVLDPKHARTRMSYSVHLPTQRTDEGADAPTQRMPTRTNSWDADVWQACATLLQPSDDHNPALYQSGERSMTKRHEVDSFVQFSGRLMDKAPSVTANGLLIWTAGAFASPMRRSEVSEALRVDTAFLNQVQSEFGAGNAGASSSEDVEAAWTSMTNLLRASKLPSKNCLTLAPPVTPVARRVVAPQVAAAADANAPLYQGSADTEHTYSDPLDRALHDFAALVGLSSTVPMHVVEFAYVLGGMPNASQLFDHFFADELPSTKAKMQNFVIDQRDVIQQPLHDNELYPALLARAITPERLSLRSGIHYEVALQNTALQEALTAFVKQYHAPNQPPFSDELALERQLGMWLMQHSEGLYPVRFSIHYGAQTPAMETNVAKYRLYYVNPTLAAMADLKKLYFSPPKESADT